MATPPVVAVLGLGAMGHAFATNLLDNDFSVRVWNRSQQKAEALGDAGALACSTPGEAVEQADVVITMLPDGDITRDVLLGEYAALERMPHGAVLAQMGTIGVDATERLISEVTRQRADIIYIDAPVSGTKAPAEQGQVVVLASGDREAAKAVEPVFAAIAKDAKWLGEAGAGSRMKLVINSWLLTMMQGVAETALLADRLGFSTDDLWDVLDGGPLAAPYIKNKLDKIKGDDFDAQMALAWGLKDANLALEAADELAMPALERVSETWTKAVDAGHGDQDISVVYRYLGEAR